jgi:hypothetical protein
VPHVLQEEQAGVWDQGCRSPAATGRDESVVEPVNHQGCNQNVTNPAGQMSDSSTVAWWFAHMPFREKWI